MKKTAKKSLMKVLFINIDRKHDKIFQNGHWLIIYQGSTKYVFAKDVEIFLNQYIFNKHIVIF